MISCHHRSMLSLRVSLSRRLTYGGPINRLMIVTFLQRCGRPTTEILCQHLRNYDPADRLTRTSPTYRLSPAGAEGCVLLTVTRHALLRLGSQDRRMIFLTILEKPQRQIRHPQSRAQKHCLRLAFVLPGRRSTYNFCTI